MARILFVAPRPSSFIALDRALLAERHEVVDLYGNRPQRNPRALGRAVRRADVVFGWWAHLHTLEPFTLARRLGTPTALIVGGFDVANLPEIGSGSQRGGWRTIVSRWVMRRADVLATNAHYSACELERNVGIPADRVTVIHHGVPDPFGADPVPDPDRLALTVGNVDTVNLERKGLRPFVAAAGLLPDVSFEVVGRQLDGAADALRALAGPNVALTGFLAQDALEARLRRAAVYVQASQHEGFGVSVAEAMLAGAIPVVTPAGALPEVVGDTGVVVASAAPGAARGRDRRRARGRARAPAGRPRARAARVQRRRPAPRPARPGRARPAVPLARVVEDHAERGALAAGDGRDAVAHADAVVAVGAPVRARRAWGRSRTPPGAGRARGRGSGPAGAARAGRTGRRRSPRPGGRGWSRPGTGSRPRRTGPGGARSSRPRGSGGSAAWRAAGPPRGSARAAARARPGRSGCRPAAGRLQSLAIGARWR